MVAKNITKRVAKRVAKNNKNDWIKITTGHQQGC